MRLTCFIGRNIESKAMSSNGDARLLSRGTTVLSAIGMAKEAISFKEIQSCTDLPKATLSRILSTLRKQGFVRVEPSGRCYTLGPHMLDLVAASQSSVVNRIAFKAEIQRLADTLERPVWHWTLEGTIAQPFEQVLPFGMEPMTTDQADPERDGAALDGSAPGMALLAAMPPDWLARVLPLLPNYGRKNSDLSLRLGFSAATGFAIHDTGADRFEIAAAIIDASGLPAAALCVTTLPGEFTDIERHQIGRQLSFSAQKVSVGPNAGPRKADVQAAPPQSTDAGLKACITVVDTATEPDKVGTSPFWDVRNRRVVWGDSLGGALNWVDDNGANGQLPFASLPGALVPYEGARAVVASRDGISIVDYKNDRRVALSHPEPNDALRRFSVAKTGPDGRVWVGTLQPTAGEGAAHGRLYAFGRDGQIEKMLTLERGAKGLCWSPDGSYLYLTEAGSQTILRFEMDGDTGRAVNPRRFARHIGAGTPNGIATDRDGCIWATIYGGWQIVRFDPSGARIGAIDLPVPLPTGLCFCGRTLQELFVTNCRLHVPPDVLDVARQAGKPLRIKVDAVGIAQPEFRMF